MCPVDEDGEMHRMIPDDVEEGSQVYAACELTSTCFYNDLYCRSSSQTSLHNEI